MPVKKTSFTFAPASRNTLTSEKRNEKQEEHVPRHIELTAVLKEISKHKNKSNRIDRFEKTDRSSVKNK